MNTLAEQIIAKFDNDIYESDQWFVNNLIGLLRAELALSKKEGRELELKTSLEFIEKHRPLQYSQGLSDDQRALLFSSVKQITRF